jgi:hypothetical protein
MTGDQWTPPAWVPSPPDVFQKLMSGEISPREAAKEARHAAEPEQRAFNDHLRDLAARQPEIRISERQQLRGRLFGPAPERPRDDHGRFASTGPEGESGPPASAGGFDGGPQGPVPPPRSDKQRTDEAVRTLAELHPLSTNPYGVKR